MYLGNIKEFLSRQKRGYGSRNGLHHRKTNFWVYTVGALLSDAVPQYFSASTLNMFNL